MQQHRLQIWPQWQRVRVDDDDWILWQMELFRNGWAGVYRSVAGVLQQLEWAEVLQQWCSSIACLTQVENAEEDLSAVFPQLAHSSCHGYVTTTQCQNCHSLALSLRTSDLFRNGWLFRNGRGL